MMFSVSYGDESTHTMYSNIDPFSIYLISIENDITDFDICQDSRCNPGSSSHDNAFLLYVCNVVQRKGTKTSDKNMVGHDLIICSRYKSTLLFIALTANGFFLCGERGAFALSLVLHLTIKQNLPFFVQNHAKICTGL